MNKSQLRTDIETAINRNSAENGSDTPDFILAEYLMTCLEAFDKTLHARSAWYSHHCHIGGCDHHETKVQEVFCKICHYPKSYHRQQGEDLFCGVSTDKFIPEPSTPIESKVEVKADSPSLSLIICKVCGKPFNEYGCREYICHAPPEFGKVNNVII